MVRAAAGGAADGSALVWVNPQRPEEKSLLLTEGLYLAASPEVSYDGESVLFSGKRDEKDHWQIWELHMKDLKLRQITESDSDCRYPTYLPDGRIIYSRYVQDESMPGYHVLETCELSGDETKQLTFAPVDYRNSMILSDGRVLAISREVFPESKEPQLMVMRPDGTKKELFYESEKGLLRSQRMCQTSQGLVVFSENTRGQDVDGSLISVEYNRPLGSRKDLTVGLKGDILSVSPDASGELTVSFRPENEENYGLYFLTPEKEGLLASIYKETEFNILDAVWVGPKQRPKKLPSAVDPEMKTALLMCQNANFSGIEQGHTAIMKTGTRRNAVKVELLGIEGKLGTADLEKDGSVYLKVAADTPFRIQTLDSSGALVEGPSSWINLRPNERRGCVGCHAGHERVPENRQPMAVQKSPVEIPEFNQAIIANALKK